MDDESEFQVLLFKNSDGLLFQQIVNELTRSFRVKWVNKINGLEQRYWDFQINEITLTLHSEHYLGIMIFADKNQSEAVLVQQLIKRLGKHFSNWKPLTG